MVKLAVHAAIEDEFQEAYLWYARRNPDVAEKFRSLVHEAFDRIAQDPLGGTAYDVNYRFYRLKKYPHLVIYRHNPGDDTATVVAISPRPGLLAKPMTVEDRTRINFAVRPSEERNRLQLRFA